MLTIGQFNAQFRSALATPHDVAVPLGFEGDFGGREHVPLFEAVNAAAELFRYPFRSSGTADIDDGSVRLDVARMLFYGMHVVASMRRSTTPGSISEAAEEMASFVDDDWIIETLEALELDHLPFLARPMTPRDTYFESLRILRFDLAGKLTRATSLITTP